MQTQPLRNARRARILDEVKLWAARRYGERANAISAEAVDIIPDSSGDADYIAHLDLSYVPDAPNVVQIIKVSIDPDGTICLATGD
jgi:hypothetical protein